MIILGIDPGLANTGWGVIEATGPAALGIDFQLKDVIAFSILVLVLIVRPSGILGEKLSEEKL